MNKESKLSNNAIKSWMISRTITILILLIIYGGIIFLVPKLNISWLNSFVNNNIKVINIIFIIIIALSIISAYIEPFFEYKQWTYRINEEEIFFKEGVFFIRSVTIPIIRIQNIKLKEGPINRKFSLASVQIGTAGGQFEIPNLDKKEVEKIIKFLREKINENVKEELLS